MVNVLNISLKIEKNSLKKKYCIFGAEEEEGAGGAGALPPSPHHFLEQNFFFPGKIGKHNFLHVNTMWDFILFTEQDMSDQK